MNSRSDFARFFAVEAPQLRRFLRRFGPAISVEDIAQDSFAQMCATDPDTIQSPRAYLFRTARNLALNEIRRLRTSPLAPGLAGVECEAPTPSPEQCVVAQDAGARFNAALALLPDRPREALILFKLEGLSHKEIGQRLGVSHRTVERYIAIAMAHCHNTLGDVLSDL